MFWLNLMICSSRVMIHCAQTKYVIYKFPDPSGTGGDAAWYLYSIKYEGNLLVRARAEVHNGEGITSSALANGLASVLYFELIPWWKTLRGLKDRHLLETRTSDKILHTPITRTLLTIRGMEAEFPAQYSRLEREASQLRCYKRKIRYLAGAESKTLKY
jgi:hypothetical protein